jgi:hypothetical protein
VTAFCLQLCARADAEHTRAACAPALHPRRFRRG